MFLEIDPGIGGFWSGDASRIDTNSDAIRINADGAATAQVDIGLVGPTSEAGIEFGSDAQSGLYRRGVGDVTATGQLSATTNLVAGVGQAYRTDIGNTGGGLAGVLFTANGNVRWMVGAGTPEGAVAAPVGSLFTRTDGAAATTLYVKEAGSGDIGWAAK